jgi:hypothetical protein
VVLDIIHSHKCYYLLTEGNAQATVSTFAGVPGKGKVSHDQQEPLDLSFYGGE